MTNQFIEGAHRLRRSRQEADAARRGDRDTAQTEYEAREAARQAEVELRRHGEHSPARLTAEQRAEHAQPMRDTLAVLSDLEREVEQGRARFEAEAQEATEAGNLERLLDAIAYLDALPQAASRVHRETERQRRELGPWRR